VGQEVDLDHSIKVADLLAAITKGHSGPSILIFDMCLSRVGSQTRLNTASWPRENAFVLFSASAGQTASETADGGLFTRALLPLLTQPGTSTSDILTTVLGAVMEQSQSTQVPYPFPHLAEPFYFVPGQQQ
jgi:hypothetical protein